MGLLGPLRVTLESRGGVGREAGIGFVLGEGGGETRRRRRRMGKEREGEGWER